MSGAFPIGGRRGGQRAAQYRENIGRGRGMQGIPISTRRFEHPETSSSQRLPAYRHSQYVTQGVSGYVSDANQDKQIRSLLFQEDKKNADFTSKNSGRSFNQLLTELSKSKISMSGKTVILQYLQAKAHTTAQPNGNIFACWHNKDFIDTILTSAKIGLLDSKKDNSTINEAIAELLQQILLKLEEPQVIENMTAKGIEILFHSAHFIHAYDLKHAELENAIFEQSICIALKNKDKLSKAHLLAHGKILESLGKKISFNSSYMDKVKELARFMLNEQVYKKSPSEFCFQFANYLNGIGNLTRKAALSVEEVTEAWQFIIKKLADNYANVTHGMMSVDHNIKSLSAMGVFVDLKLPLSSELDQIVTLILTNLASQHREINNDSIAALYCSFSTLALKKINSPKLMDATIFFTNKLNSLEKEKTSTMKFEYLTKGTLNWVNLLKLNQEELRVHRGLVSSLLFKTTYLSIQNPGKLVSNNNLEELLFSLFIAHHDLGLINNNTFKEYLFQVIEVFSERGGITRVSRFTEKLNELLSQYITSFSYEDGFTLLINKLITRQLDLLKKESPTLFRQIAMTQTLVSLAKNTSLSFSLFISELNKLIYDILPNFSQLDIEDKIKFTNAIGSVGQAIKNVEDPVTVITQIANGFSVCFPISNLTDKNLSLILRGLMGLYICLDEIEENQDVVLLKEKINSYIDDIFTKTELEKYLSEDMTLLQISLPMVAVWLGKEYPIMEKICNAPSAYQSQISRWQSAIFKAVKRKYPTFIIEQEISIKGLPEVDILLPEKKLIVEIQGPHHYVADNKGLYLTTSLLKKQLYTKLDYIFKEINLMNCSTVEDGIKETLRQLEIEFEQPSRVAF